MSSHPQAGPDAAPVVSAIVVNWKGRLVLGECLASLFAQTYPRLEVILVDNGPEPELVDEMQARYGERLRVIRNRRNEGFARGNNQGIAAATGEWIFLLNNDAVADPGTVEELVSFARDRPAVGMLACRVVSYDSAHIFDSVGLLVYPDGVCRSRGWEEKDLGQYDQPEAVLAPNGCAAAYRRRMLEETGLFDETYFAYLEDLDLGMRGQLRGWSCWYVPTARVRHRKSHSAGVHSKFKAYFVERNRIWNAVKFLPPFLLCISPLFTVNRYLLQAYAAATRQGAAGRFARDYSWPQAMVIVLRAHVAALWRLPQMIAKRRAILRGSRLSRREWYDVISRFKLDAIELALK